MREIDKYGTLKEKLQGLCEEHDLIPVIHNQGYPFRLTIKPAGGMDSQQTMMEGMDNPKDTGYISPDASLVFVYKDAEVSYKISETWTISATLFNKLKNLFMKLCNMWMAYFFRDIHEHNPGLCRDTEETPDDNESEDFDNENEDFVTEDPDSDTPEDDSNLEDIQIDVDGIVEDVDPFDILTGDAEAEPEE